MIDKDTLLDELNRVVSTYTIARLLQGGMFDQIWRNDMLYDMLSMMIYHQIIRRYEPVTKNNLTDKVVKTLTIVIIGNLLNGNFAELPEIIILSIIGTVIYYNIIRIPVLNYIKQIFPKYLDPDCVEDWIEDLILTSLNDRNNMIIINIITKLTATGIYYHIIKPVNK
jgi:hypothetical protein